MFDIEEFGYDRIKTDCITTCIASEIKGARIIGVTGASASGKSTFSSKLFLFLGEEAACLICLDDYVHLTKEEMAVQGIKTRYDWRSRDKKRFLCDISKLRNGHAIEKPTQNYEEERPSSESEVVFPKEHIIVEGNLDLTDIADITIFLYAPDHVLLERRLNRDKQKQIHSDVDALRARIAESLQYYHQFLADKIFIADFIIDTCKGIVYKKN